VLGVGNPFRRDDGIGHVVVDELAARGLDRDGVVLAWSDGEPAGLLDAWQGATLAVVVDAVLGAGPAGTVLIRELPRDAPAVGTAMRPGVVSGHRQDVAVALRLGASLGRLPDRLIVVGVEAEDLGTGPGLSAAVGAAVPDAVAAVRELLSS
jgi:hydrogenase maturation protease